MKSVVDYAIRAGLQAHRSVAGAPVTYSRGATTLTVSHAVQTGSRKAIIDRGGSEAIIEMCDWLIEVNDLAGLNDTPDPGDIISRTINDTTYTWTVEHREIGESHFDWSDAERTQYRIRSRKDGATAYEISRPTGFDLAGTEMK